MAKIEKRNYMVKFFISDRPIYIIESILLQSCISIENKQNKSKLCV